MWVTDGPVSPCSLIVFNTNLVHIFSVISQNTSKIYYNTKVGLNSSLLSHARLSEGNKLLVGHHLTLFTEFLVIDTEATHD